MGFFGTCIKWLDEKRYGFIRLADGRDVFCHAKALQRAGFGDSLPVGARVELDIEKAPDGRLRVARLREAFGAKLGELAAPGHG